MLAELAQLAEPTLQVVRHAADYRVDGEVGRFRFGTFNVEDGQGGVLFSGTSLLPPCQGRQWYPTWGFKELALLAGVTQRSYRKTADYLNRHRRQPAGGTPINTLRDQAEAEGTAVLAFLDQESTRLLKRHGFTAAGTPLPKATASNERESPPATLSREKVEEAWQEVEQRMQKQQMSASHIRQAAQQQAAVYEDPAETVNIHVDDVGVKEQKERRGSEEAREAVAASPSPEEDAPSKAERKRPMVYNTVARIEQAGRGFTLTGRSVLGVLRCVLAFLLRNELLGQRWRFFTDGQRSLQNSIVTFFAWHRCMSLILDWFHVGKKCREELSLALKGREVRNRHLKQIVRLLWYGLVSEAVEYLRNLPPGDIKSQTSLERLAGYFERNRPWIPCYALRASLGLPNSSNPVERTNNLVTASRQKKNGMSWSEPGSQALTALSAVVLNGHTDTWIRRRKIPFAFQQTT
jgi:hypothetical protein